MSETVFKEVHYTLRSLLEYIGLGEIALPDIQRPFVWRNTKVRDLFDSMYRGYPIGYLLFWQNGAADDARTIGVKEPQKPARLLIVDGQQRLTSLYAVIKGVKVLRENYSPESIQIAFSPITEKFEVADAAIKRDRTFIADISELWRPTTDMFEIADAYLKGIETDVALSEDKRRDIKKSIAKLHGLLDFPFTALELSSQVKEEDVSDVFVRINSKGTPLNQADFILTLMSVFWDDGRAQLEAFCRQARNPGKSGPSAFNHFVRPDPDQLLRAVVGLGFRRAKLQTVYSILRGKDLETGEFSGTKRDEQFAVLRDAQERVLNLQHWHDFLQAIKLAGFRNEKMISSQTTLLFSYTLYLIGLTEFGVNRNELRTSIAQWFFMSSLTGRYTSSPESAMDFDLARLREVGSADSFLDTLRRVCNHTLTPDFWQITLPTDLATSSPRSPSLFAYHASLVLLNARALYSNAKVADLLDPAASAYRSAVERHHLFPRKYLASIEINDLREVNQIANFALVEWSDNAGIASRQPSDYAPELSAKFTRSELEQMSYWHALPSAWEQMPYADFLVERRTLMAKVISDAYQLLIVRGVVEQETPLSLEEVIGNGESTETEFKSTLRINMHTNERDPRIELSSIKTLAGFLNTKGGTLIIGVTDDGTPCGVGADGFENEDKMSLHLINIIKTRIGPTALGFIHPRFEPYESHRVLVIECAKSRLPVYVKDGDVERFYIRTGPSTTELTASQTQSYIATWF